jgi:hypothetical protein
LTRKLFAFFVRFVRRFSANDGERWHFFGSSSPPIYSALWAKSIVWGVIYHPANLLGVITTPNFVSCFRVIQHPEA